MKADEQPVLPFDFYREERDAFIASIPRHENPKDDNERLINFQRAWLADGDGDALGEFQALLERIALKMINKETWKNRHIRGMPVQERREKAHNAAVYMTEQLLSRDRFFFGQPDPATGKPRKPTGYLFLRVYHELYYRSKPDTIVDFVDLGEFFKEGTEDEAFHEERHWEDVAEEERARLADELGGCLPWFGETDETGGENGATSV